MKEMKSVRRAFGAILIIMMYSVSQAQTLDRIVAVVGNDMILESELNAQVQFFVFNNRIDPKTQGLKEQVLQSMINEKLIVAKAIEDSVTVTDEEVSQQLDAVLQQRIQQVGSESRLEDLYGMPLSRIKREFRDEMRKNLLAQKLQQQRFGTTQISRLEVEEFFKTYKDSLGQVPEEVELAHIFVKPKFDEEAKAAARQKLQALVDSITAGAAFSEIAKRHSEDPGSAAQGGDLGFVRRGQFVKEFESAVFALQEGTVSGIVESEFGLHIIQLLERRGEAVHPRHILIRIERTKASDDSTIALLKSLRERAVAGENFADLAKKYSQDEETASIGGSLGVAELEQLDKNFYPTVAPLKEGEINEPAKLTVGNSYGYHIVLMKKRTLAHEPSLEHDYHRIETIAMNYKRNKEYASWLEGLKNSIYWEARL
ncbi:MAG: peptidylprolyl isomerase [Ignavibacteriae bacterium]|nr:peptidylprolyl isomerase [Ignavibacteriota bacterium]